MFGRDPKTIWKWMKVFGINTRPRGTGWETRLPLDGSPFRGKTHTKENRELIRQARLRDGRKPYLKNGKHWLHHEGAIHPNWKGGISAERQAFYWTPEWKKVSRQVYVRDKKTCQRCGAGWGDRKPFDIHHIVSFQCKELRATLSNLVLLCESCHYWVHGPNNIEGVFIRANN